MNRYCKIKNGVISEPTYLSSYKDELTNKTISGFDTLSRADLKKYNHYLYVEPTEPQYNKAIEELVQGDLYFDSDNDLVSRNITIKTRDINKIKLEALQRIESEFKNISEQGYECSLGFEIDADEESINNWGKGIDLIALAEKNNFPLTQIKIRIFNNTERYVSVADYYKMSLEVGLYHQGLLAKKWAKKNEIEETFDPNVLLNIHMYDVPTQ
jgi:hypothetical protein